MRRRGGGDDRRHLLLGHVHTQLRQVVTQAPGHLPLALLPPCRAARRHQVTVGEHVFDDPADDLPVFDDRERHLVVDELPVVVDAGRGGTVDEWDAALFERLVRTERVHRPRARRGRGHPRPVHLAEVLGALEPAGEPVGHLQVAAGATHPAEPVEGRLAPRVGGLPGEEVAAGLLAHRVVDQRCAVAEEEPEVVHVGVVVRVGHLHPKADVRMPDVLPRELALLVTAQDQQYRRPRAESVVDGEDVLGRAVVACRDDDDRRTMLRPLGPQVVDRGAGADADTVSELDAVPPFVTVEQSLKDGGVPRAASVDAFVEGQPDDGDGTHDALRWMNMTSSSPVALAPQPQ